MEPHALIADYDASGRVTLHMSSQSTFFDRFSLMGIFGMPANKIRIISPYLGGGFGSKSETHSIYVVAIQASMNLGRPVRMFHSRDEEFTSSRTRHPEIIYMKTGVKADGTITARSARVILDNGAYTSYGPGVSLTQSMLGGAVYRIPAYHYDGYTVYTNNPMGGAFRGFGSPQFTFAAECHTDMIAERLGMDAVEFRMKNLSQPGDVAISGPDADLVRRRGVLREGGRGDRLGPRAAAGPRHRDRVRHALHLGQVPPERQRRLLRRGREGQRGRLGVADDRRDRDRHRRGHDRDGDDLRRGARHRPRRRRRDLLGLRDDPGRLRDVRQSRVTTLSGNAVRDACAQVREQLFRVASEALEVPADAAGVRRPQRCGRATTIRSRWTSRRSCSRSLFRDRDGRQIMAQSHYDAPCSLPDPETGVGDFAMSYSFGAHAVEVEVDEETGHVRIVDFVAATDCGNLVNPALAESQVEGGAAQGIGYGLMEDLIVEEGQVMNPRFSTYRIPTATEMPPIRSLWVETNDPRGPYGAKGLGEMGLVPTAAAIANAVKNATGARITRIPLTPERVHSALGSNGGEA